MSQAPANAYHWVDLASAVGAIAFVAYQRSRGTEAYDLISRHTGLQFLNGLVVVPLILMIGSAFSQIVQHALYESSPITLAGRGSSRCSRSWRRKSDPPYARCC